MLFLFVFAYFVQLSVGSRILVVFPVPYRSHTLLGDSVVRILLDGGHKVTYISSYSTVKSNAALQYIDIGSNFKEDREKINWMDLARNSQPPQHLLEMGATFAQRTLQHHSVRALLEFSELTFDAVVAEWYYSGLLAPLASFYECPLIWYSSVDASWMNLQLVYGQTNPAYAADPQTQHVISGYSLRERLERLRDQVYLTAWMYYMLYYVENPAYHDIYRNPLQLRGRHPPSYEKLVYNATMLLINSQPLIGQTLALPANVKYVGGHHIEDSNTPLPKDFQQLLDSSKAGVIYFSLGSYVKSKDLPKYMKMQLVDIFAQFDQTVIWEYEELMVGLPKNLHVVERAPRTSILNHTNTMLFISDRSLASYTEAKYFGVPIIRIPTSVDQFLNAALSRSRGHGIRVRFSDYLPYSLRDAIHKVLSNYSYQSNAKKTSVIFKYPIVPPQKELLYWIELVIHHDTSYLRSPAVHLSIIERLYLDVAAVALMFLWFLSKVWKVIKVHWNSDTDAAKKDQ